MKFLFQILLLVLTWLTTFANATPSTQKLVLTNYSYSFLTTENQQLASEVKIGVEHFARSGICENSVYQKAFLQEGYVLEETHANASKTLVNSAQIAVDVISLAIPGGQTVAILKALNYADKLGSVASIMSGYVADDYPQASSVLNFTSSILGLADLSFNGVDAITKIKSTKGAWKQLSKNADSYSASTYNNSYKIIVDRVTSPTPDADILEIFANEKSRAWLEAILQQEKNLAHSAEHYDIANDLQRAIDAVRKANGSGKVTINTLDAVVDNSRIANRVKTLRQQLTSDYKLRGNFGWAETEISGLSKSEYYAHSAIDELTGTLPSRVPDISLKPQTEIFPYTTVPNAAGYPIARNIDTEYKILTEVAQKLGSNTNATGKIRLFTERPPCSSCSDVIDLFSKKYPKIEVEVIHNNGVLLTNF